MLVEIPSFEDCRSLTCDTEVDLQEPRRKLLETDWHRLEQRQKQIDYGKNTLGYHRYTRDIPRNKRTKSDPHTPDIHQKCSKRSFDGQIKKWRRLLHAWDPATPSGNGVAKKNRGNLQCQVPAAASTSSQQARESEQQETGCSSVEGADDYSSPGHSEKGMTQRAACGSPTDTIMQSGSKVGVEGLQGMDQVAACASPPDTLMNSGSKRSFGDFQGGGLQALALHLDKTPRTSNGGSLDGWTRVDKKDTFDVENTSLDDWDEDVDAEN